MLEKRYSGDFSEAFWEVVHLVDDDDLAIYELGCQLQTLEGKVLAIIGERCQLVERLKTAYNKRSHATAKRRSADCRERCTQYRGNQFIGARGKRPKQ